MISVTPRLFRWTQQLCLPFNLRIPAAQITTRSRNPRPSVVDETSTEPVTPTRSRRKPRPSGLDETSAEPVSPTRSRKSRSKVVDETSQEPSTRVGRRKAKRKPAEEGPLVIGPKAQDVRVAGLDYGSVTAAICYFEGREFAFDRCKLMYVTNKKTLVGEYLDGSLVGRYLDKDAYMGMGRYLAMSDIFADFLSQYRPGSLGLENYAMSVTYRSHLIGEHHGMLKYRLHTMDIPWVAYTTTSIKRTATGKGKAEKREMVECFTRETGVSLRDVLGTRSVDASPINDIVDAYYVCKLHFAKQDDGSQ